MTGHYDFFFNDPFRREHQKSPLDSFLDEFITNVGNAFSAGNTHSEKQQDSFFDSFNGNFDDVINDFFSGGQRSERNTEKGIFSRIGDVISGDDTSDVADPMVYFKNRDKAGHFLADVIITGMKLDSGDVEDQRRADAIRDEILINARNTHNTSSYDVIYGQPFGDNPTGAVSQNDVRAFVTRKKKSSPMWSAMFSDWKNPEEKDTKDKNTDQSHGDTSLFDGLSHIFSSIFDPESAEDDQPTAADDTNTDTDTDTEEFSVLADLINDGTEYDSFNGSDAYIQFHNLTVPVKIIRVLNEGTVRVTVNSHHGPQNDVLTTTDHILIRNEDPTTYRMVALSDVDDLSTITEDMDKFTLFDGTTVQIKIGSFSPFSRSALVAIIDGDYDGEYFPVKLDEILVAVPEDDDIDLVEDNDTDTNDAAVTETEKVDFADLTNDEIFDNYLGEEATMKVFNRDINITVEDINSDGTIRITSESGTRASVDKSIISAVKNNNGIDLDPVVEQSHDSDSVHYQKAIDLTDQELTDLEGQLVDVVIQVPRNIRSYPGSNFSTHGSTKRLRVVGINTKLESIAFIDPSSSSAAHYPMSYPMSYVSVRHTKAESDHVAFNIEKKGLINKGTVNLGEAALVYYEPERSYGLAIRTSDGWIILLENSHDTIQVDFDDVLLNVYGILRL